MKTVYKIIGACLAVSIIASCDIDKITSVKDEFKISVTPDAVESKITIQVSDENNNAIEIPEATIVFEGDEGADKIYTPAGKKEFKTVEGVLTVGLTQDLSPTVEEPILFNMKVEAPGFESFEGEVSFDGQSQSLPIVLRKTGEIPNGSIVVSETKTLVGNMTNEEIVVDSDSNTIEEVTTLTMEAGTSFEDEDGNPITGSDVRIDAQTFNTSIDDFESGTFDTPGGNVLPSVPDGGFNIEDGEGSELELETASETASKGRKNKSAATTFFPIGNPYCFYVYVNGRKVYRLSRDTKVQTYFSGSNTSVINPFTKKPAAVGDVVDVYVRVRKRYRHSYWSWWGRRSHYHYRYSNQKKATGKKGVIKKSANGRYYVEYTTRNTGVHYFGFTGENVSQCSASDFESIQLKNSGRKTFYYFIFTTENNKYLGFSYAWIGEKITIPKRYLSYYRYKHFRQLYKGGVKMKAYGYNYTTRRYEKVYDKVTTLCDLASENIDLKTSECIKPYNIDVNIDCPKVKVVFNNTRVYYKKEGDRWFRYYHRIVNGSMAGTAACLDDNTKYQFRLLYDGVWRTTPLIEGKKLNEISLDFDTSKVCEIIDNY